MKTIFALGFALLLYLFSGCSGQSQVIESTGNIASAHPLATAAGQAILDSGGNAFDAAIAVASTLNVVEPMMSGIGGYGTILIYDSKNNRIRFLNPSGRFPVNTNTDLMREPTPDYKKNRYGPKSISTPGNLNAWKEMHDAYGSLDWGILFNSAIELAENGFALDKFTSLVIEGAMEDFSDYTKQFYSNGGSPLKSGETLKQVDLANTYRIIANEGVKPFYFGEIGESIDRQMKEVGSFLTAEDLKNNIAEWWEPIKIEFRDYEIYTASLPANSFAAFVNIGLMNLIPAEKFEHNSSEYLHLFAEMTKESYKARLAFSFDPEIKEAPLDSLLSEDVLKSVLASLNKDAASTFVPPHSGNSINTTHFVVIDNQGNIVSATQTLGNAFGSRVMVEGRGIWLNNSMAYSTFEPKGNPMDAFPGRHKLSGDCPVIILKDGKPWAALGSPGGHTITQNVPQIIFNLIDYDMTMQEAIDAPKIAFAEPNILIMDKTMPRSILKELESKGHNIRLGLIGNAQGIRLLYDDNGKIDGFEIGSDRRGK